MEFRKKVTMTLYVRQQKRHRCKEQNFGLCGRRRGWDDFENIIETCILSYVKQIASIGLMHETVCSGLVHQDDPEGWDGRVRMGNTYAPMADSCECMAKTTTMLYSNQPPNKINLKKLCLSKLQIGILIIFLNWPAQAEVVKPETK